VEEGVLLKKSLVRLGVSSVFSLLAIALFSPDTFAGNRSGTPWPCGIVPYEYDANITQGDYLRDLIEGPNGAMRVWEGVANIHFVNIVDASTHDGYTNYVVISKVLRDSASSDIGMYEPTSVKIPDFNTVPGLQNKAMLYWKFVVVHELGHALGLVHEHQRMDAVPANITILSNNLINDPEVIANFVPTGVSQGQYDYDSVMHYSRNQGGQGGKDTILPTRDNQGNYRWDPNLLGQRDHLSNGDISVIRSIYGMPFSRHTLAVEITGDGHGTVKSTPDGEEIPGIVDSQTTRKCFDTGQDVRLDALRQPDSAFLNWTGDIPFGQDVNSTSINMAMDIDRTVGAGFYKIQGIEIQPLAASIQTNQSKDLTAVIKGTGGLLLTVPGQDLHWSSSDQNVAVLLISAGTVVTVLGNLAGTSTIALSDIASGKTATSTIAVTMPNPPNHGLPPGVGTSWRWSPALGAWLWCDPTGSAPPAGGGSPPPDGCWHWDPSLGSSTGCQGGWVYDGNCPPPPPPCTGCIIGGEVITSSDPNDKTGTTGVGSQQYISGSTPLSYAIFFSNKESASAPAQDVVITDQLDLTKYDLGTLTFGPIAIGDKLLTPASSEANSFSNVLDLRSSNNLFVRITGQADPLTGLVTWRLTSVDPLTAQPPADPSAGFLSPGAEGSVFFTVMPKPGLPTDTKIQNKATIVFDANAPIDTNHWTNTIDNTKPSSHLLPLAASQTSPSFNAQWAGTDVGSGISDFTVYVSDNGGPFTLWLTQTAGTQATYVGLAGHTYSFFSVARDLTGNVEDIKTAAEATTAVVSPAMVAFASAAYSVNEGGAATTIVSRSGDVSAPLTVSFTTNDGTAKQNRDYILASGALTFGSGESTKSFTILTIDNLYVDGDRTVNIMLTNPTGGILSTPSSAVLTITDNDSAPPTTNPLDNADARFFVRQHYYDFLNRLPDQGGLDYWVGQITQCGSDQSCIHNKRIDVSNAFFFELEYQQTAAYIFRLYRAAYGNNQPFPNPHPDPNYPDEDKKLPAYAVFAPDRARVVGGADLASGQQALANQFVQRPEFLAKYPASQDGPTFVTAVLATVKNDLGVDLTSQSAALLTLFNSGGRGAVMYRLADQNATNPINNQAFIDEEYNRAFVFSQYSGYLRRDADIGGFLFWLGQVNSAPLRDTGKQHAMVCSFITSAEYQQRFSPVVTHTNAECPH
jgi:hypothetical protein